MMGSTISMRDNILDIFGTTETEVKLFQEAVRVEYFNRIPEDKEL